MKKFILIISLILLAVIIPSTALAEESSESNVKYTDISKEDFLSNLYTRQINTSDIDHLAVLTPLDGKLKISGTGYHDSHGLKFGVVWSVPFDMKNASVTVGFPDLVLTSDKNEIYVVAFNNSVTFWRESTPSIYFVIRGRKEDEKYYVSVECTGVTASGDVMLFTTHNGLNRDQWVELNEDGLTIALKKTNDNWAYYLNGGEGIEIDKKEAKETLNEQFDSFKGYLNVAAAIDEDLEREVAIEISDVSGLLPIIEIIPPKSNATIEPVSYKADFVGQILPIIIYSLAGLSFVGSVVFGVLYFTSDKRKV